MTMHSGRHIGARVSARLTIAIAGFVALAVFALGGGYARAAATETRPSFVVIQTDDQTLEQLYAAYTPFGGATIQAMPNTLALLADRGVTFNRYYTPYSLCAPSRVSLLTGRYAHNNNVRGNVQPEGGFSGFA